MKKNPTRNQIARELFPELHRPKSQSRGLRPSDDEIAKALTITRGRYGHAAVRLRCSERSLRGWVSANPELEELVQEQRELLIDQSECVIDEILNDPKHPRRFDAARFIAERLGRHRGYGFKVEHTNKVEMTANVFVPIDQRDFQPEAWDTDEHARWAELSSIPTHQLTHAQLTEMQDLMARARVIELHPDAPPTQLKPLPPPKGRPLEVADDIDRSEAVESEDENDEDADE